MSFSKDRALTVGKALRPLPSQLIFHTIIDFVLENLIINVYYNKSTFFQNLKHP